MNDVPTTPAPVPISILPTAGGSNPVPAQTDWVPVAIWVPNKFGPGAGGYTTYKIQIQFVGGQGAPGPAGPPGPQGPPGSAGSPGGSANQIQVNVGGTSFGGITNGSAGQVLTAQAAGPPMFANAPGGSPGGTSGQVQFNSSGTFGGFTFGGDATLNTSTGNLIVTKTNGVNFAASATTDTTNASNISSGNLSINRLNGGSGASATTFWCGDNTWKAPSGGGGATVTISDTPPGSPTANSLWWESDTGLLWIYYNDGTSSQWVSATGLPNRASNAGVLNVQVFTTSGTYVPTNGMQSAYIECVGGGGGGSGCVGSAASYTFGAGGGAGGYSRKFVTASQVGTSQVVTIGAGGTGGAAGANIGGPGGATSVGSLCIANGARSAATATGSGLGAVPGSGDIAAGGAAGGGGASINTTQGAANCGNGASSIFGGGAPIVNSASGNGTPAQSYGSGGAGGASIAVASNFAGGSGSPGLVIITEYAAVAAGATTTPAVPGQLNGLVLTWNSATSLSVSPGGATADDNSIMMINAGTITKPVNTLWTSGGMLDIGTIAPGWYHVFLIENPSNSTVDALISLSPSAPNLPSGFTKKRRIGSIKFDGSNNMLQFSQYGDQFMWSLPVADMSNVTVPNTVYTLVLPSVPTGVKVIASVEVNFLSTTAGSYGLAWSPDAPAGAPNTPLGNFSHLAVVASQWVSDDMLIRTNTSAQILLQTNTATGNSFFIITRGWMDNRGKG